jgi:signal transduction histidine kinase
MGRFEWFGTGCWLLTHNGVGAIFHKFYRVTDADTDGTNFGLAVTKGIIDAYAGSIVAENRKQGGLKFVITMPIREILVESVAK